MKIFQIFLIAIFSCSFCLAEIKKEIISPNGSVRLSVNVGSSVSYSVYYKNKLLIASSGVDMVLQNGLKLSDKLARPEIRTRTVNEVITSAVPEKRRLIPDVYNEATFRFTNSFGIIFRVYDDGVAYRITTGFKDSIVVQQEIADISIAGNPLVYYPEVSKRGGNQDQFHASFEEHYQVRSLDSIVKSNLIFTPLLMSPASGPKIVITESDLEDYPGMFLEGTGTGMLKGVFAPYPKKETVMEGLYALVYVSERENYLARTRGTRQFPWRVFMIAEEDKDLPVNDLVYRLASPSRVKDVSWIKPGKATDEWIIASNIFNVPFKSGINTETYKYYIDFAKRFGFERIMIDAGWSDNNDLFKITPTMDMDEIMAYAKSRNIGVSMWTLAMTLDKQLEPALAQFKKWGVDFIMTDFIERDDQKAVQFYYKIAEACARHKIMIMFHGAFKPAGFNRTFPHAIAREAVLGSEYNIWSDRATPEHNLLLPFIRMTSGPLDYEPGLLDNATKSTFKPIAEKVMSFGTRTQQLAMFVVYDSPMQFFSGNPSQGYLEPEFMELMGSIPTTWDTTIVADAKLGDYIVTARKKNKEWYIGAMNDLTARELTIPLGFLGEKTYQATICEDGVNADRYASDYKISAGKLSGKDAIRIKMAPGGGYVIRLREQ